MRDRVTFKSVFIAVFIGTAAIVVAFLVNAQRPKVEVAQPSADLVKASGKCAECHRRETSAIVHQYEGSKHAAKGVTCLDCHRPAADQHGIEHKGFTISEKLTAKNCQGCHTTEYEQFARSRHAAPAWAAVAGRDDFSPEQLAFAKKYHPEAVDRAPNGLAQLEGASAIASGCQNCHSIGKPNADGSFGTCTPCHSRHSGSIELAREPTTCGQCQMGPDHSQIEIYEESKHGALFTAQRSSMNLSADPKHLTTSDMPVPTWSTCHMSGIEGLKVTHDVGERLSWYLFAAISQKRPGYPKGQDEMKEVCEKCHTDKNVDDYFERAEKVVESTNTKIQRSEKLVADLRKDGLLTPQPFDEEIEFLEFDMWHYYGRTAKHGAFMGGADFVQWHGNYELLHYGVKLESAARELRAAREKQPAPPPHD